MQNLFMKNFYFEFRTPQTTVSPIKFTLPGQTTATVGWYPNLCAKSCSALFKRVGISSYS